MAEHQDKRRESAVEKESTGPIRLVLLITVVQKGKGTFFSDYLQETFGSNLQIAIVGNGTAEDNLAEFLPALLREFGVTVAGEVDEIPAVVDEEMVDELGLARSGRGHRELALPRQHVDKGRFAHVGAPDEGKLRQQGRRLPVGAGAASCEAG